MIIQNREYQTACIESMFEHMHHGETNYGLVVMATGSGKTIVFSKFCEEVYKRYSPFRKKIRICLVAHREKLVEQMHSKLLGVWSDSIQKIGLACASYDKDIDIDSEIIIGSIQTISSRIEKQEIKPFDIVIIDEAHRIPPVERDSAYKKLLLLTEKLSPKRKVFGFTASPFQLGYGYIYGKEHKAGFTNWFDKVVYTISMDELIDEGHLVPYRIKQAINIGPELRSVPIIGGEYKSDVLGNIMCEFVESAISAYEKYGEGRKRIIAFCSNIKHADMLTNSLVNHGYKATSIHSKISNAEKARRFQAFSDKEYDFLVSVDSLIEGFDEPDINLVMMIRPTKSPAVYVQQGGRGLRLFPEKKDLLILDLADNVRTHGMLSHPIVVIPGKASQGDPPIKICPECYCAIHASVPTCSSCGYVFPKKTYREPLDLILEEVDCHKAKYTRESPTLAKIKNVSCKETDKAIILEITFIDPLTQKVQRCHYFINFWKFKHPKFLEEWESLTNLQAIPEKEDILDVLSAIPWPKAGYFHKENPNGSRWPNLCGWHDIEWDGIFPEINYAKTGGLTHMPTPTKKPLTQKIVTKRPSIHKKKHSENETRQRKGMMV